MPMDYPRAWIAEVPHAASPLFQHLVDTYAGEISKVASVWTCFAPADMPSRVHPRSMAVREVMKHELLSARRFFADFLGSPEPPAEEVPPAEDTPEAFVRRLLDLSVPRLAFIASRTQDWWLETAPFFDVVRERIWIFWRRVLHTAHHRTQLGVALRLLGKPVPPTYGPTADITWQGASPTLRP